MEFIYVLIDPISEEIRYVGWTSKSLRSRYYNHIHNSRGKNYKDRWVRKLKRAGLRPRMTLLQSLPNGLGLDAECYWVAYFRSLGCPLTNSTDGGEGLTGYRFTQEARVKMSQGIKAAWVRRRNTPGYTPPRPSEEVIDNLRKSNRARIGTPVPEQIREKMRKKHKAYVRGPHSDETKEKLRQATLRQFQDPKAREAVGIAHKGKTISPEHKAIVSAAAKKRWAEWRAAKAARVAEQL